MHQHSDAKHYSSARKLTFAIFLVILVIGAVVSAAYWGRSWPEWTGFGAYTQKVDNEQGRVSVVHQPRKTLWDMLQLLIVPAMLAGGAYWLAESGKRRERQSQERQAQETALQNYLDKITDLLLKNKLDPGKPTSFSGRVVARSRTLTALRTLDGIQKGIVVRFLYESGLITGSDPVIKLDEANLGHASLSRADLQGANLRGVKFQGAILAETNFTGANLQKADLSAAKLTKSILHDVTLRGANLSAAVLSEARFHAAPLTEEQTAALPPHRKAYHTIKDVLTIAEDFGRKYEELLAASRGGQRQYKEDVIKIFEKRLEQIRERKEVWAAEGRDIIAEQVRKDTADQELASTLEKMENEDSDEYRAFEKDEKDNLENLRKVREELLMYIWADLRDANLEGANLQNADLRWVNLKRADLTKANLQGANLSNADLSDAKLDKADLTNAVMFNTEVKDAQLAKAKSVKGAWRDGKPLELPRA